jgi:hypothetical protein
MVPPLSLKFAWPASAARVREPHHGPWRCDKLRAGGDGSI